MEEACDFVPVVRKGVRVTRCRACGAVFDTARGEESPCEAAARDRLAALSTALRITALLGIGCVALLLAAFALAGLGHVTALFGG